MKCKECHNARQRFLRANLNPEEWEAYRVKERQRHHAMDDEQRARTKERNRIRRIERHGLTETEYDEIFRQQGFGCGVCGDQEPGSKKDWHIDHDHSHCPGAYGCKECVRGILCTRCNVGLGMFGDDRDVLWHARYYLTGSR